jgi:hypothetical protein
VVQFDTDNYEWAIYRVNLRSIVNNRPSKRPTSYEWEYAHDVWEEALSEKQLAREAKQFATVTQVELLENIGAQKPLVRGKGMLAQLQLLENGKDVDAILLNGRMSTFPDVRFFGSSINPLSLSPTDDAPGVIEKYEGDSVIAMVIDSILGSSEGNIWYAANGGYFWNDTEYRAPSSAQSNHQALRTVSIFQIKHNNPDSILLCSSAGLAVAISVTESYSSLMDFIPGPGDLTPSNILIITGPGEVLRYIVDAAKGTLYRLPVGTKADKGWRGAFTHESVFNIPGVGVGVLSTWGVSLISGQDYNEAINSMKAISLESLRVN